MYRMQHIIQKRQKGLKDAKLISKYNKKHFLLNMAVEQCTVVLLNINTSRYTQYIYTKGLRC